MGRKKMKVKELKEYINQVDDDFDFWEKVKKEEKNDR